LGSYSLWRVLHGGLGALGLLVLFGHTGFRLGHNLNLALMLAFLLSAISGAASGILVSVAAKLPADRPWRRISELARSVHDYAFWPIPLLAVFHVLKVYYY
jgi:nitrite reductase (NADH) large subunit